MNNKTNPVNLRKIRLTSIIIIISFFLINILNAQDAANKPKQKIIFDCDLGSDIDDAFALALILSSPEFECLGIVLDHGMTQKRAQIAAKMIYITGRTDIPIVVGRETNNVIGSDSPAPYSGQYYWAEGFNKVKYSSKPAVDFIIENLKKYPNEVILITVGPLPNIGDVLRKDPNALKLAKHVYSMFGSFYAGYGTPEDPKPVVSPEWNVRGDLEASKLLVNSGAKITYCGLDVTTLVWFNKDLRFKLLMRQSPLTNALSALTVLWSDADPCLHDAVTVSMILWPELFTTRPAHVKIVGNGYTVIDESQEPNAEVTMTCRVPEFLRRMTQRFLQQNLGDNP